MIKENETSIEEKASTKVKVKGGGTEGREGRKGGGGCR